MWLDVGRRGPKSTAEKMAPVPAVLPQRPGPPRGKLDTAGRRRWRALVNELPTDRLRSSDLLLLADMITAEQGVAECDKLILQHGQVIGPGVKANPAVYLRQSHLRSIVQIQRALRLCPSMRKRQEAADLQVKVSPKKPWEA